MALVIPLTVDLVTGVTVTPLAFTILVVDATGFTVALFTPPMSLPQELLSLTRQLLLTPTAFVVFTIMPVLPIVPVSIPSLITPVMISGLSLLLFTRPLAIFIRVPRSTTEGMAVGCCQNRGR
jgi:hypothetical protein